MNASAQVNLGSGSSPVGPAVADNLIGIGTTLTYSLGNLDGRDDSFSSAAQPAGLGNSITWNSQTFAIGPALYDDVIQANGQAIQLPQGQYTSLMILGASTSGFPETNLFYVHYTDGTFDTITQAFSDWQNGYTGTLGSTGPGESVALAMNTYLSPTAVVGQHVDLYGYVFPVNPGKTVSYLQLPYDPSVVIVGIDEVYHPEQVNLGDASNSASPAFNTIAISTDARTVVSGSINTYSADALGNTITWNGQTFDIGPATVSVNDAVATSGNPPIILPQGQYTSIQFLASAVGNAAAPATFNVYYSDGSSDTFTVGISSWSGGYIGQNTTAAWESIAETDSYYNSSSGSQTAPTYLYGYALPTNPTKTVTELAVPNNSVMHILAVDVVNQPEQVNLGDATNDSNPAFNTIGVSVDARTQVAGGASTYSANALGNTVTWNAQTFEIGPATVSVDDAIAASGNRPIMLPEGQYTSVQFLASSSAGGPVSGVFYVAYSDGTTDTFTLGISSWTSGYDGATTTAAWESIAASTTYYNSSSGRQTTNTYLYGYVLPTNPTKTVTELGAPNNNNIRILAVDVVDQPEQANLGDATASASPPVNVTAITTNAGATWGGSGIDGSGDVYSANAMGGSTVNWNGQVFYFGAPATADAVAAEAADDPSSTRLLHEHPVPGHGHRRFAPDRYVHRQLRGRWNGDAHPDGERLAERLHRPGNDGPG